MQRAITAGMAAPQTHDLIMVDDDVTRWQFKLKGFDDESPGAHYPGPLSSNGCCKARQHLEVNNTVGPESAVGS